ncbi:hypothetical protein DZ860_14170 [Vibrio sinensis]|uniref:Uncharacterized protein n=1 Tax=Vibrio sinensis TaxID=2302434 RepID=A0A3A6QN82_9VIBR|nr:hypothetical protein [Vibrio sinensis]RJX70030.1 hypothetical protein DZ860_14170 [Vibrio sinensis]
MSLDRVEEQIPLLINEIEALSSQIAKHIGLLSTQAERSLPECSEQLQLKLSNELSEIEDLASLIANSRCNNLSDQLIQKLAMLRSYLHE